MNQLSAVNLLFIYLLADTQTAANNAKESSLNQNIVNYLFKRMKYLNKHKHDIGQYKNELYYLAVVLTFSSFPCNVTYPLHNILYKI